LAEVVEKLLGGFVFFFCGVVGDVAGEDEGV
jgi:hypothetical protein